MIAGLLPVVGVCPSRSRFRFLATSSRQWRRQETRSSRALPRLSGTLLRCRRLARGGGVRFCRLLYRMSAVHFVKGVATTAGDMAGWRVDQARVTLGTSRRRASIHGRRSSGCVLGRCFFNHRFNLVSTSGVYCGSLQSYYAMGLLQIWMAASVPSAGDGRKWRSPTRLTCTETRDLLVFFCFLWRLLCKFVGSTICICSSLCTGSLSSNADTFYIYKKRMLSSLEEWYFEG